VRTAVIGGPAARRGASGLRALGALLALLAVARPADAVAQEPFLLGPPPGDGPVVVSIGVFVSDVNEIDLANQRFEVEGILTMEWHDPRLAFDTLAAGVPERVFQGDYQFSEVATGWWPQLIVANESGPYQRQGQLLRQGHDGAITYVEEFNATVEIPVELRHFPFDREEFEIVFEVMGFDASQVVLAADTTTSGLNQGGVRIAEWDVLGLRAYSREYDPVYANGHVQTMSTFVAALELRRRPGFILRVVVFPMTVLVALSWSVFWMDRESLGNRMDISFLGILTVVAYQLMVSSTLPRIPYFTLMGAFIYISFLTMCAAVLVNLRVSVLDRTGRREQGDALDRRCRWAFPMGYVASLALATLYFFVRY